MRWVSRPPRVRQRSGSMRLKELSKNDNSHWLVRFINAPATLVVFSAIFIASATNLYNEQAKCYVESENTAIHFSKLDKEIDDRSSQLIALIDNSKTIDSFRKTRNEFVSAKGNYTYTEFRDNTYLDLIQEYVNTLEFKIDYSQIRGPQDRKYFEKIWSYGSLLKSSEEKRLSTGYLWAPDFRNELDRLQSEKDAMIDVLTEIKRLHEGLE